MPNQESKKGYKNFPPKVFIRTFGCQMNSRDSELVAGLLLKKGYRLVDDPKDADVILFNACSVRQHAEDKVWSEIGRLKRICQSQNFKCQMSKSKKKNIWYSSFGISHSNQSEEGQLKRPIVGLIGCMAQNWQQAAFDKEPMLDLVVGPNNIDAIPDLIEIVSREHSIGLAVGKRERDAFVYNTEYISGKAHCNVNIMEGCNNFCSYCVVPYVRGMERSRSAESIISEIKELVIKGVTEITLLGQNVNSYRSQVTGCKPQDKKHKTTDKSLELEAWSLQPVTFVDLLKMVNDIEGLKSFDFITSHPKDAILELFKVMAELSKLNKFLHLPVQSGSDRILSLMNRGYSRTHYLGLIKDARRIIPNLRLTTDVMVGFPTETEEDFKDTFDLMKKVKFDAAYIFKYSPRPHTKAAEFRDDVPAKVKQERNRLILDFQRGLHKKKTRE